MSANIIVIGSNCFTGSHIVNAFMARGEDVIGISRSAEYDDLFLPYKRESKGRFQFHQVDIVREFDRLVELLEKEKPHTVVHVAALSEVGLSNERPVEYFDVNTLAVVKLCHYLRSSDYLKQYIHISSAEILGTCDDELDETALFNPSTPYAVSKAAADMFINTLVKNYDFPATLIRSTNVYGVHQQLFKIIPRTAIYLKLGKKIMLHGGGTSKKSFIHVRDVVGGLLAAYDARKIGTYHFSVPSDITIANIVELVCSEMGKDFSECAESTGERLGQDAGYFLNCSKAESDLGWAARIDFTRGVREVIGWVDEEWEQIQRNPLDYQHKV